RGQANGIQTGMIDSERVIEQTKKWIANVVIGLNLCPFARRVFDAGAIRYVVTDVSEDHELLVDLERELLHLCRSEIATVETTLLIHPNALQKVPDYNDFLADADFLLLDLSLNGIIQIASFHPHYRFEGTEPDAV